LTNKLKSAILKEKQRRLKMADLIWGNNAVSVGQRRMWHLKDTNFLEEKKACEALEAVGGGHKIELRPVMVMLNGKVREVEDNFALVRTTGNPEEDMVFEYVTGRFNSFNPEDVCKKFDEKVGKSVSTLGFIQEGKKMFISWVLPSFDVVKGDTIELFANTLVGFDSKFSVGLYVGSFRAECANTWNAIISSSEKNTESGRGRIWSSKHTNKNLLYELGEWMEFVAENAEKEAGLIKSFFGKLVNTPIRHESEAKDIIAEAYKYPENLPEYYPEALKAKKQEVINAKAEKIDEIRDDIYNIFSTKRGIAIDQNSFYGLFNSASQYWTYLKSKKDTNYSIMYGNRAGEITKFAEVLKKHI
jgi:hypothetical protein